MPSNHLILLPPSSLALNLSQHQGLFQQVGSSPHVAKVLELQHQPFQEIFRVDLKSHHTTPIPSVLSWVSIPGMTTWFKDQKQEVPKEVSEEGTTALQRAVSYDCLATSPLRALEA